MASSLPLTLEERKSVLDGIVFGEIVPKSIIKAVIKSGKTNVTWDVKNYAHQRASNYYDNEVKQLEAYCKRFSESEGMVLVEYSKAGKTKKNKYGRVFPNQALGLTSMPKRTRNTLIKASYLDFDLENAQVSIILSLCRSNDILCTEIDYYCNNREALLKQVQDTYNVTRSCAKKLFLHLCFLGRYEKWMEEHQLKSFPKIARIVEFEKELTRLAERFKQENPILYDTARKNKETKGEKNFLGSFFSLYLQEYELRIVERVICWLNDSTCVLGNNPHKVCTYEFDGIKLYIPYVEQYGGKEKLLRDINQKTLELTGFELNWTEKAIEDDYDVSEYIDVNDDVIDTVDGDMKKVLTSQINKMNDAGVCEMLLQYFPDNFVYQKDDKKFYCWNRTANKWEADDTILRKTITYDVPQCFEKELQPFQHHLLKDDKSPNYELLSKHYSVLTKFIKEKCKESVGECQVVNKGKTAFARSDIVFDNNPNLVGFDNGVVDLNELCFRPYKPTDYVTWSCGYDFKPMLASLGVVEKDDKGVSSIRYLTEADLTEEDLTQIQKLRNTLKKILPNQEHLDLVLTILASGVSGKAIEKFFIFNGNGRNGKGFLHELVKSALGNYYYEVDSLVLQESKKFAKSRDSNPEVAGLAKKRIVFTKEPAKEQPLQNATVKDMTGGGCIKGRMNNSNKTEIPLWLTLIMECNVKPNFAEEPEQADANRIVDINFGSHFTADESMWDESKQVFPVDPTLKSADFLEEMRNYVMNLLLSYYISLKEANFVIDRFIPDDVKQRSIEYLQKSFDVHKIFVSYYEKIEISATASSGLQESSPSKGKAHNDDVTLAQVVKHIRKTLEFMRLSNAKKENLSADDVKKFFTENKVYKNDVYTDSSTKQVKMRGWRMRNIDGDEDDDFRIHSSSAI